MEVFAEGRPHATRTAARVTAPIAAAARPRRTILGRPCRACVGSGHQRGFRVCRSCGGSGWLMTRAEMMQSLGR